KGETRGFSTNPSSNSGSLVLVALGWSVKRLRRCWIDLAQFPRNFEWMRRCERGGEVKGGGIDLRVVNSCLRENPCRAIGEVGGDSRGVEGRAD
ncbi:hypothetical protein Tco_0259227, partial [Tanacetum coccineum]